MPPAEDASPDQDTVLEALYRYSHAIDHGDVADFVDCFTPSAVFEVRYGDPGENLRFEGSEALGGLFATIRGLDGPFKHLIELPLITMTSPSEAEVVSYSVVFSGAGTPHVHALGRYLDRLDRGQDGKWRLAERVAEVDATEGKRQFVDASSSILEQ